EAQAIRHTERVVVDRCLSAARLFRGSRKRQTTRGYASCGDKRMSGNTIEQGGLWQETPRSAWWRMRSRVERIRCFLHIANTEPTHLSSFCECGIMLFLGGSVSCVIFLRSYNCHLVLYFLRELCFRTQYKLSDI
ncbi:unnamed protein product, partial [Ascophyllum nodosum]